MTPPSDCFALTANRGSIRRSNHAADKAHKVVNLKLQFVLATTALTFAGRVGAANPLPVARPEMVTREEWRSQPQVIPEARQHKPQFITIHHAGVTWKTGADPLKFVRNMQKWGQTEKHWPDLPYHFLIAPDGRIFEGRPLQYEPESNTKYDLQGHIGVELMGNFEEQRVNHAQLNSCAKLVAWLCDDLHIDVSSIAGHKDRAQGQTTCPGRDLFRYLQEGQFLACVSRILRGETSDIKLLPPLAGGPTNLINEPEQPKPKP